MAEWRADDNPAFWPTKDEPPMTDTAELVKLAACPFCGETPDINGPHTFQSSQGTKWGSVVCCCTGPEVRTGYGHVDEWRDEAIKAWNTRAAKQDGARGKAELEKVYLRWLDKLTYLEEENARGGLTEAGMSSLSNAKEIVKDLIAVMVWSADFSKPISGWRPTPAELAKLNAGEPLFLHIQGRVHPVVALSVGHKK